MMNKPYNKIFLDFPQFPSAGVIASHADQGNPQLSGDNRLQDWLARWRSFALLPTGRSPLGWLLYPWGWVYLSCLVAPGLGLGPLPKSALEPGIWELNSKPVWCKVGKRGAPNGAAKVSSYSQNIFFCSPWLQAPEWLQADNVQSHIDHAGTAVNLKMILVNVETSKVAGLQQEYMTDPLVLQIVIFD